MFSASNQYKIERQLGGGGFGVAYLVRNSEVDGPNGYVNDRLYVIKEVNLARLEANAGDAETRAKIRKMTFDEAELMKSLDNRNIVKVYSSFLEGDVFRISMEYCESGTLKDAIFAQQGIPFTEPQIRHWMAQLATTLKFLHNKRILHRDVKAENVFLAANRSVVKLGDFGIAKSLTASTSVANTIVGTITHMPPELLREEPYTFRSEVWAFGIIIYELIALRLPFYGSNPGVVISAILSSQPVKPLPTSYSVELRELVEQKLLNKEMEQRPTMLEVIGESLVLQTIAEMANLNNRSSGGGQTPVTPSSEPGIPIVVAAAAPAPRPVVAVENLPLPPSSSSVPVSSNVPLVSAPTKVEDLLKAAKDGDLVVINEILSSTPKIRLTDPETWRNAPNNADNDTPLHLAAWRDQVDAIALMWPRMAELSEWQNNDNQAPIHLAALANAQRAVEFFIDHRPSLLEYKNDFFGRAALHAAAERGHFDLVKMLVMKGANVFAKSSGEDNEKLPIHLAAVCGHLKIVEFLLEKKPELVSARSKDGDLPIHMAALGGHVAIVDYFVRHGADVEARNDKYGRTALHLASEYGHVEVVEKLVLTHGADVFAKSSRSDFEKMPIHMAAWQGRLKVVQFLIRTKPNLANAKDAQGFTPLQRAEASGQRNEAPAVVEFFTSLQTSVETVVNR